jgi:hypothetical protein
MMSQKFATKNGNVIGLTSESGGGVNQRKRVGMTYLPTIEVKNVNRCFRHLLNVLQLCARFNGA